MYNLESTIYKIKTSINKTIENLSKKEMIPNTSIPHFEIEIPADKAHGDLSANVALVSSKTFKMPPRQIAEMIIENLNLSPELVYKTEIAGPGFINFFLGSKFFTDTLKEIHTTNDKYGETNYGNNKKIMIEFVSANPTGPMHMGNARSGALGDCLAPILKKTGHDVYKEFYVNDAGNQIEKFGLSLDVRYQQKCLGEDYISIPQDCYQGQDIVDLASEFFDKYGSDYINEPEDVRKKALVDFALPKNIKLMQKDMGKYKVVYDNWFYESDLHKSGAVDKIIDLLTQRGFTYEKDDCVWYRATKFGSEKDEVLRRKNGIPTYFAADIAYHYNKFAIRGFDTCINIWGADHHGHVARMKNAMDALGLSGENLHIILMQMVRLIKNGEVVRMSKRTGKAIQLSDLIDEVGPDSARFIFNTHEINSTIDFDLDLAVQQDSKNPVYYVQYAYARICSIFRQLNSNGNQWSASDNINLELLNTENERKLIYFMALYPGELLKSAINYDPTKITRYVISLANLFHKFYSSAKVVSENKELSDARLFLCNCVRILIKNILDMMQVDAPEKMN